MKLEPTAYDLALDFHTEHQKWCQYVHSVILEKKSKFDYDDPDATEHTDCPTIERLGIEWCVVWKDWLERSWFLLEDGSWEIIGPNRTFSDVAIQEFRTPNSAMKGLWKLVRDTQ